MIVDFYEALDVLVTAVAVWIVIGVAAVTGFGLAVGWIAAMAWRGLRKPSAAPLADEQPSGDSSPAEPSERRTAPRWKEAA